MIRGIILIVLVVFLVLGLILVIQFMGNGAYNCGRCGLQKWGTKFLWVDLSVPPEDEYGIAKCWEYVHKNPCDHIWLNGPLGKTESKYWPPLHLAFASSYFASATDRELDKLNKLIVNLSNDELLKKDVLGRTILHWLVVHPDVEVRNSLKQVLIERGLSMDTKDQDGLSPRDWEERREYTLDKNVKKTTGQHRKF